MSGELLLINPKKRRKGRKSSRRHKNPHRRHRRSARRHNPVRHHRRHRNPVHAVRRARRRRRNPLNFGGVGRGFMGQATNALMGAGGAIVNDVLINYVPLPAMLKTGPLSILTKLAGAFGVGYLASFAVGKARGALMTEGALTVLAYQIVKPMVATVLPLAGTDIEGLGYYSPGMIMQDTLSPLPDLNEGTPLAAYISGLGAMSVPVGGGGARREGDIYDPTIDAYIS